MFLVDPLTTPKPYWMKKWIQMTSVLKSLAPTKVSRTQAMYREDCFCSSKTYDGTHFVVADSTVHRPSISSPIQSLFIGSFSSSLLTLSAGNGHYLSSLALAAICH